MGAQAGAGNENRPTRELRGRAKRRIFQSREISRSRLSLENSISLPIIDLAPMLRRAVVSPSSLR
jgi:hypothetical protein